MIKFDGRKILKSLGKTLSNKGSIPLIASGWPNQNRKSWVSGSIRKILFKFKKVLFTKFKFSVIFYEQFINKLTFLWNKDLL